MQILVFISLIWLNHQSGLSDGKLMSEYLSRNPILTWRVLFWLGVAMTGVFWIVSRESWKSGVFAALFCGMVLGGIFFLLNSAARNRDRVQVLVHENRGKLHQTRRRFRAVLLLATVAAMLLKLLAFFLHK